jgi:putative phosphoesterase
VELAGQKFLVHHIINPRSLEESIAARIRREKPHVVVFGHTHKPFNETLNGTLYFNPGYAGNSRFGMERSVAILHWNGKKFRPEYFRL